MTPVSRFPFPALIYVIPLLAVPMPAGAQTLAVRGGTVHSLAGPDVANGTVVIERGRISAVGTAVSVPAGATVIDASGLHVYPGWFDAAAPLGLTEINAVDVTNDRQELGTFNPQLLAYTAVHPPSEHIPVARANGITHAVTIPVARSGGIGGQASLINMDGWTVEEMLVTPSVGVVYTWPTISTGGGGGFGPGGGSAPRSYDDAKKEYDEQARRLTGWLEDAKRYDAAVKAAQPVLRDLKLEAFSKVTRKELPLLINVDEERYIRQAVEFAGQQDVNIVILGGEQAYKVGALLAEKKIPVILGQTQALPSGDDQGYDEQYAAPAALYRAGVKFAFATFSSPYARTLPYQAGNAVPYGLPRDEALKAITLRAAEIFGAVARLGTIEVGKIGNLIVVDGDPLDYKGQVKHLVISGHEVSLDNKQLELYQKYRGRPKR
ncbi:MAG: amidohydrolase family protein [Gemmatimonadetes bacterium]|nr:amidohydrolase family protein [Gemmatimonadota bacterium]